MDKQGRVIRLEFFSKTIFPGLRLIYFVANSLFTERLLRATEVETQDPAGLSQAFTLSLLEEWGVDGYLEWMQRLKHEYRTRRDWVVNAFYGRFEVLLAAKTPVPEAVGLVACIRNVSGSLKLAFSFLDRTPACATLPQDIKKQSKTDDPEREFAQELWEAWAKELVLLTPGSYYNTWQGQDKTSTSARGADPGTTHFRFSFATPSKEQAITGVRKFRTIVGRYWT